MKLGIYIPTHYAALTATTIAELCDASGGCTALPAVGYWRDDQGQVVEDRNLYLFTLCDSEAARSQVDSVLNRAAERLLSLGEQAVLIDKDNTTYRLLSRAAEQPAALAAA